MRGMPKRNTGWAFATPAAWTFPPAAPGPASCSRPPLIRALSLPNPSSPTTPSTTFIPSASQSLPSLQRPPRVDTPRETVLLTHLEAIRARCGVGKPKVFSVRPLFEAARQLLGQHFDVEYWTRPERVPRSELLQRVRDKDALICLLTEKVNDELLDAAPRIRIAATVSVGFDNIDVPACTRRKVVVTHTPGVLDDTTADFAFALMMAVARRIVEGDAWMRSGDWPGWDLDQLCGGDIWGKTLGILGFGRIGRRVAQRARGFRMRILYNDAVRPSPEIEKELGAEFVERDRLFAESDFISVHVPLLPDTRHLIGGENLARMKRTAYL